MKGDLQVINEYIALIKNRKLRSKVEELLHDPKIAFNADRLPIHECPAGSYVHHSYKGGLMEHTVAVVRLAVTLCDIVSEVYGGRIDRDTVIAGAILHDVMKCYVYALQDDGRYASSGLGEKIDHLTLLVAELYKRDFPLEVLHVAASHHGDQSPIKPKTLEALVVSLADLTDSELNRNVLRAAEYLARSAAGKEVRLSSREAMEIVKAKSEEGLEAVR
ncbi:HD domain-containing protein, partial [Candidatus Bathyarchaeota archaeon]|nr:HD domain-containing protein [Candidatus Bathyarchaeota archaeon]